MNMFELFLIAVGLSMDAFAVSICKGLGMVKADVKKAVVVGLYFGLFQAAMPLIGYFLGSQFADHIMTYDHWIAFVLLGIIGLNMVKGSFEREDACAGAEPVPVSQGAEGAAVALQCDTCAPRESGAGLSVAEMLPLAIATSIDALAVGITFAFLRVNIVPAVTFIGLVTFSLSAVGVGIGHIFGAKYKSKAELTGGVILILMGCRILLEHLGYLG